MARLLAARHARVWDTRNPVRTSDRRDCRVRGGFGDYLLHIAETSAATTRSPTYVAPLTTDFSARLTKAESAAKQRSNEVWALAA